MYKIKANELLSIAIGAKLHFKKLNEMYEAGQINMNYNRELDAAKQLRKWLLKTHWNEDAEFMIDEMPF